MKNIKFWKSVTNYTVLIGGVLLVAKMFFYEYIEKHIMPFLVVGIIAVLLFLVSELMKVILKNNKNG